MSRIFDVVQSLSGQKNSIVIPRPYVRFFAGDQQALVLGALLNQIVFWSGVDSSCEGGWFYKSHKEMGEDLETLSEDQVGRLVKKLCTKYLPGIIETKNQKVNGTPTAHYRIDGDALIAKIFPPALDSAKVRNGKRESTESNPQNRGMETAEVQNGNRESAESFLYTDQDIQIIKPSSCPDATLPDESHGDNLSEADFISRHPQAVVCSARKRQWGGKDDLICAEFIWSKIIAMYEQAAETCDEVAKPKEPNWAAWANEIRLMVAQDGRTHKQICSLFKRANQDGFWCKNILSPSKLREKWDELSLKLSAPVGTQSRPSSYVNMDFSKQDYSSIPSGFRGGYSSEQANEKVVPVDRSDLPKWLLERTGGAL